ncbi:hypothetical protein PENANT_c017G05859 [Penicillium antarcticum]|uniref:Uncharacterized protein n=1 Tax=Penicillium antarcticum TaxID=416450 RepID=A0A1V6Q383_9EURO|nr:hypothetical protein PENANT_c017G05859 [Penicillium antarcticum]
MARDNMTTIEHHLPYITPRSHSRGRNDTTEYSTVTIGREHRTRPFHPITASDTGGRSKTLAYRGPMHPWLVAAAPELVPV